MPPSPKEITQLLIDWRQGDEAALNQMVPLVYEELRRLARYYMRGERQGHTLQTSALVNEAYLRLIDYKNIQWQDRAHFFAIASQAMRRILVDHARSRNYAKRGGGGLKVSLDEVAGMGQEPDLDLIALDDALAGLARIDQRKSQIVELRYFGGLNVEETAEVLGISPVTVMRDWSVAKMWLLKEISRSDRDDA